MRYQPFPLCWMEKQGAGCKVLVVSQVSGSETDRGFPTKIKTPFPHSSFSSSIKFSVCFTTPSPSNTLSFMTSSKLPRTFANAMSLKRYLCSLFYIPCISVTKWRPTWGLATTDLLTSSQTITTSALTRVSYLQHNFLPTTKYYYQK